MWLWFTLSPHRETCVGHRIQEIGHTHHQGEPSARARTSVSFAEVGSRGVPGFAGFIVKGVKNREG